MDDSKILAFTADIVAAHVAHNTVSISDVPTLIRNTHAALLASAAPPAPATPEKPAGAVPIRGSIKPDGILSMIDGRPYKMLKHHIARHGFTPETYRRAFDLPASYPMVAPAYADQRSQIAKQNGLGTQRRKP